MSRVKDLKYKLCNWDKVLNKVTCQSTYNTL